MSSLKGKFLFRTFVEIGLQHTLQDDSKKNFFCVYREIDKKLLRTLQNILYLFLNLDTKAVLLPSNDLW